MSGAALSEPEVLVSLDIGRVIVRVTRLRLGTVAGGSLFSVAAAALVFRRLGVIEPGRRR